VTLVAGAVLPHAPLLLPEVTAVPHAREVVAGARSHILPAADVTIVVSGHGRVSGVYQDVRGSLTGFGLSDPVWESPAAPDVARGLAAEWGKPILGDEVDHGVLVPIRLGTMVGPFVGVCLRETTGPGASGVESAVAEAHTLVSSLAALPGRVAVVASAHTAASLTPRAPLTERPEGRVLDDAILDALGSDVGKLAEIPARMWRAGGSCGSGPLTVLGLLFIGARATVIAYAHPVGVGYLVARVDQEA
jgi:hypothetical protein